MSFLISADCLRYLFGVFNLEKRLERRTMENLLAHIQIHPCYISSCYSLPSEQIKISFWQYKARSCCQSVNDNQPAVLLMNLFATDNKSLVLSLVPKALDLSVFWQNFMGSCICNIVTIHSRVESYFWCPLLVFVHGALTKFSGSPAFPRGWRFMSFNFSSLASTQRILLRR